MAEIPREIERLHRQGWGIHWTKGKVPTRKNWANGKRQGLSELKDQYKPGLNPGVRLGRASIVGDYYLAVLDLDVKDPAKEKEAINTVLTKYPQLKEAPYLMTGRGGGSRHFYIRTKEPVSGGGQIKAKGEGWDLQLLSDGRQALIVGAVHPVTGKTYEWGKPVNGSGDDIPVLDFKSDATPLASPKTRSQLEIEDVDDVSKLPLNKSQLAMLTDGVGADDRSVDIYWLTVDLLAAGVAEPTILGLFTDPGLYLGQVSYDHAKTQDRQTAARWFYKYVLNNARQEARARDVFDDDNNFVITSEMLDKKTKKLKTSYGVIKAVLSQIGDPLLKRDGFAYRDIWQVNTPWGVKKGAYRNDDDLLIIKSWFCEKFKVEPNLNTLHEAISCIALDHQYNPLKDYLLGLKWDGVERVENALITYHHAKGRRGYLKAVSARFMQACVQRVFEPGCKFDHMLVLEGEQGVGKSTFGRILAGSDYFLDNLPSLSDKDAALYLQGTWICEIAELASMRRSDVESTKAFVARSTDKFRPPYGRTRVDFPRVTVFLGTTNSDDYLTDRTGNRRFWPVLVGQCDFKRLEADRDQLWAEAVFNYFFDKKPLWLEGEAKEQALLEQENRLADDESVLMGEEFSEWLENQVKEKREIENLKLNDLFNGTGPFRTYTRSQFFLKKAGSVLTRAGYTKKHTMYGKVWVAKSSR